MKAILIIGFILVSIYITNVVKLIGCDFEAPYRCEAIHATGTFVPPAALVTVWFESDGAE